MNVKKNRRFSSSRVAFCALGLSVLTACGGGQSGAKMGDDQFAVQEVTVTSSNQNEHYPATIKGLQDIEIRPQVSGFIVKLCVDEGATVRKGQALFQIDPTQYKAAYDQAKASVASAKANLETVTSTEVLYGNQSVGRCNRYVPVPCRCIGQRFQRRTFDYCFRNRRHVCLFLNDRKAVAGFDKSRRFAEGTVGEDASCTVAAGRRYDV